MEKTIRIKYHTDKIDKLQYIDGKSDWIDLRAAEDYTLKKGDFKLINLGVSVEIPKGYEMLIASRSSTFKNFGLIQTNAVGIVDESYCADSDVLMWPCLATRDTQIHVNDRLCQFIRLTTWAWMDTSRAEMHSSAIISFGFMISARAIPTRWRCPPENWWG